MLPAVPLSRLSTVARSAQSLGQLARPLAVPASSQASKGNMTRDRVRNLSAAAQAMQKKKETGP